MILSGRDLQWYIETGKLVIDPIVDTQFQQNGVDLVLESMKWEYGMFHLGCTRETIKLPDDLMAFVELRSSWARRGYFLPPTIVDAGFCGNLTLEVLVAGKPPMSDEEMPMGKRFAHLIFAKTTSPCIPYAGKYQHQTGITYAKDDGRNLKHPVR